MQSFADIWCWWLCNNYYLVQPYRISYSLLLQFVYFDLVTRMCIFSLQFNLPMNCPIPGSELTREPFRWDQRLFSLVLRLAGTPAVERDSGLVPSDTSPIDAMCEVTGGGWIFTCWLPFCLSFDLPRRRTGVVNNVKLLYVFYSISSFLSCFFNCLTLEYLISQLRKLGKYEVCLQNTIAKYYSL